ncbi:hypothetical protein PR048_022586 [Dryococelus australis]|uniref:Uncharacterized protein n=1 Tax=Dryococelus australis TaxID=614101 RepID=A0ABQ9H1H3_9NEOP|nr:hypothetical protein PR048_022586 [Dryococelus australis]
MKDIVYRRTAQTSEELLVCTMPVATGDKDSRAQLRRTTPNTLFIVTGAAVAKRLACSPCTTANWIQSPAGPLPEFRMWESFRKMPLVGGFSRGFPISPAASPSSALKTSLLRASQISSLTPSLVSDTIAWAGLNVAASLNVPPHMRFRRVRCSQDQLDDGKWKYRDQHDWYCCCREYRQLTSTLSSVTRGAMGVILVSDVPSPRIMEALRATLVCASRLIVASRSKSPNWHLDIFPSITWLMRLSVATA